MNGWVKLPKEILEWEWYFDDSCKAMLMHLLLRVNIEEKTAFNKVIVKPGEIITSLNRLGIELGKSIQEIRTILKKLTDDGTISILPTKKYTHIKLEKFNDFANIFYNCNKAFNTKSTTTKEYNNINNTNVTNTLDNTDKNIFFDCCYNTTQSKEASYYVTGAEEFIESLRRNDRQY